MDNTYEFVALPPEERARIAVQNLEQMERSYFNVLVDLSIRESQVDPTDADAVEAFAEEKKQIIEEHQKRLAPAKAVFEESKIKPEPPSPQSKRSPKR